LLAAAATALAEKLLAMNKYEKLCRLLDLPHGPAAQAAAATAAAEQEMSFSTAAGCMCD